MTKEEFAQSIKQKYPQYAETDNEELANKILAKYPQYQGQIEEKSKLRKVGDFFTSSAQKFGTTLGTAASVVDPVTSKTREGALQSTQKMVDDMFKLAKTQEKDKAQKTLKLAQNLAETEGIDIFNNPEYQKTAKQVIGEGLGTGLEVASFGTFGAAGKVASKAPTALKPLIAGGVKEGVKTGAKFGGAFGTGFGVSEALQEDKTAGEIAKEGLIGGAVGVVGGAALGGALGAVLPGAAKLTGRASKLIGVSRNKIGTIAYNKLVSTSKDLMKMSPTMTRNEAKWNKNTPKFLVDEGVVNLIDSDGKRIVTDEAIGALRDKYHAESRAFNSLLTDSGEYVSLDKFKKDALAGIGDEFKTRGSDYQKAIKHVESEIAAYKDNYREGGLIDGEDVLVKISDFNRIKSGLWSKTSNFNPSQADKLMSDLNYKMGQTARTTIEDTVEDAAVKRMNSRLGDFASAIDVLEKANGKVLPGGFFGKQFTRLAGTVAGSGGGIPGSIVGNLTGGVLADLASNPKIKTSALTKLYKSLGKTTKGQSLIDEAASILEKRGEERAGRLLLKESKTIPTGPKTDTSGLLSQDEAINLLDNMGVKNVRPEVIELERRFEEMQLQKLKLTDKNKIKTMEKAMKEIEDKLFELR